MLIVDTKLKELERQGKPIRVGMIGAGYMARGFISQLLSPVKGMRLVALSNRTLDRAEQRLAEAGGPPSCRVGNAAEVDQAIRAGKLAISEDPFALCEAEQIDILVESTGAVEFGAQVALRAFAHGKDLLMVNAELDATVGPLLKRRAARAGVIVSNTDGDEPGVAMNLVRFVDTLGYRPVMAGNIKGFYNPYRNPETQAEFAAKVNQGPRMITSFADGTKLSMETTILANAAGFRVAKRGMHGHKCAHVKEILQHFTAADFHDHGLVEFVLGAEPGTGAFVVGYNENPIQQEYMRYFKMGDGPLYLFYTPYHLPQLEFAISIARIVLFRDAPVTPIGPPMCDVVAVAKRDLRPGEVLDGIGGFDCYGMIENADVSVPQELLPMGLAEGCTLLREVAKDQAVSYADVTLPPGRLCDQLRAEQCAMFSTVNTTV